MDKIIKAKQFAYETKLGLQESLKRLEDCNWDYDKALKQRQDENGDER